MRSLLPAADRMVQHQPVTYRLDYRHYALPFLDARRTAHGVWREREGLILRLEGPPGQVGLGEVAPISWPGAETLAEAEAVLARLAGAVDAGSLAAIGERHGCVRFGLASAMDRHPPMPPAVQRLPVAALLPAGREALAAAERAGRAGYTAFKWKVGVCDAVEELAMLDDLLARLPGQSQLRLDANGAWTSRLAVRWLERCTGRPIEFVEQPCLAEPSAGAEGQRRAEDVLFGLARDYPTPIALDEAVAGIASLQGWLQRGWPGIVVVKPALAGVPRDVLALLAAHHADVVFSSALETVVGRRAALRMAFQFQGRQTRALGFGILPLFQDSRFDGMPAAPSMAAEEVGPPNLEAAWNALN